MGQAYRLLGGSICRKPSPLRLRIITPRIKRGCAALIRTSGTISPSQVPNRIRQIGCWIEEPLGGTAVAHSSCRSEPDLHQTIISCADCARIVPALAHDHTMNQRHGDAVRLRLCGDYTLVHRTSTVASDRLPTIAFVKLTKVFLGYGLRDGSWKTENSSHQKREKENAHSCPHLAYLLTPISTQTGSGPDRSRS